jgi:hypothetical protein
MHEAPNVPDNRRAGRGPRLVPGLVIAIEPWFLAGGADAYCAGPSLAAIGTDRSHSSHDDAVTAVEFGLLKQGAMARGPGAIAKVPLQALQPVPALVFGLGQHGDPGPHGRI